MLGEIKKHKLDYSILAVLSGGFALYSVFFYHSPTNLFLATVLFTLCYIVWGVWHHAHSHHLTGKIVLEYFLVAALGIVIVSTLLL